MEYFRPSETEGGVAATMKSKLVVRGSYITTGRAGQRVASLKLGGHAFAMLRHDVGTGTCARSVRVS